MRPLRLIAFDFDGVFTDNSVYVFEDGREAVRCSRVDGLGLSHLKQLGLHLLIISTETNPVVSARARKLKIDCLQGVADKRVAIDSVLQTHGLTLDQCAFMGNDVNDLPCLTVVGFPVVVADAHPSVISSARYQTKALGGQGAVREVCDLIAQIKTSTAQPSTFAASFG